MFCKQLYGTAVHKNLVCRMIKSIAPRSNFLQCTANCRNSSNTKLLDDDTVQLLEKLSLVNFENQKYINSVEEAIKFADGINSINTDGAEPLVSVLEDRNLRLRDDVVTDGCCRNEILRNAAVLEEDYFVAPPGNIPLETNPKKTS